MSQVDQPLDPGGDEGAGGGAGGELPIQDPIVSSDLSELAASPGCAATAPLIAEARRQRDAAQLAQSKAAELQARVAELQEQIDQAREALDAAERRHQIDLLLIEADTVDIESARLLTELAVNQMKSGDLRAAVGELRQRKPFLFRSRPGAPAGGSSVMSAAGDTTEADIELESAAQAAAAGDRASLLRYLRARRG